jgi:hypothetical protein
VPHLVTGGRFQPMLVEKPQPAAAVIVDADGFRRFQARTIKLRVDGSCRTQPGKLERERPIGADAAAAQTVRPFL